MSELASKIIGGTFNLILGGFNDRKRPVEDQERWRQRYDFGQTVDQISYKDRSWEVHGAPKLSSEEAKVTASARELAKYNLLTPGDKTQLFTHPLIIYGSLPAFAIGFVPITIPAAVIGGSIAGCSYYGPSANEPFLQSAAHAGLALGGGALAGLAAVVALGRGSRALVHLGHKLNDAHCAKRLPEQEVRFKDTVQTYLAHLSAPNEVRTLTESLESALQEPMLVPRDVLSPRVARIYEQAKRQHPGGIYQLV